MSLTAHELYVRGRTATNERRFAAGRRDLTTARARTDDPDLLARIAGTLAYGLGQTGQPAEAEGLCREALAHEGLRAETVAVLHGQLGVLLMHAGRLDEAETVLGLAIDGLDAPTIETANCLLNRSIVHMQRHALDACTDDLRRALAIYLAEGAEETAAEARHNLGYAALLGGDLVTALDLITRSRPVIAAASEVGAAISDLDRAEVLRDAGLVTEAEELLEKVARMFGAQRMRQSRAEAEFHLARSLLTHDATGSARVARTAARRFRSLGSDSWAARAEAVRLDALTRLGTPPEPARFAEVSAELTRAGLRTEATGVRLTGLLAAARRGDTSARLPRVAPTAATPLRLRVHEVRAARAAARGRHSEARRIAGAGLDLLAEWRETFGALDLQASLGMHGLAISIEGLDAASRADDSAVLFEWSERVRLTSQHVTPVRPPHDPELAEDLAQFRMLRTELDAADWDTSPDVRSLRDRIRDRQWTRTGSATAVPRASLTELQTALEPDTAVLSYVYTGREELLCVVTTRADARVVRLDWSAVQAAMRGLRADLDVSASVRDGPLAQVVSRGLAERMARLDAALLSPVLAAAGPIRRLVLTTPGVLAGLPWGMLPGMQGISFTLAESASAWLHHRGGHAPPVRIGLASGPRVPRGAAEVRQSALSWPDARALTGDDATVAAVIGLASGVDVLHVAAHGRHAVDNPLFSGLELADGTLFGYDVDLIPRVPDLVVLSACELGRSSVRWGEEALGMTRVWLHAGARCVIAAPATVPDDVAGDLLTALHTGLAAGLAPAAALAQAHAGTGHRTSFQCHGAGF